QEQAPGFARSRSRSPTRWHWSAGHRPSSSLKPTSSPASQSPRKIPDSMRPPMACSRAFSGALAPRASRGENQQKHYHPHGYSSTIVGIGVGIGTGVGVGIIADSRLL